MYELTELLAKQPIVPYIRDSDFAVRKPWRYPERRLLDYLLVYIQSGQCRFLVDRKEYRLKPGDFCLVQPGSLVDLEGLTDTVTPYAHLDIFFTPDRERSFPTKPGQVDLSDYRHLLQPRLNDIYGLEIPVVFAPRSPAPFRDSLLLMVKLWQDRDPLKQLKAQQTAFELVLRMLEDYMPARPGVRIAAQELHWITSYFSLHLAEPLSIEQMAKRASLSPSRFCTLFKEQYGMPPHRYLLDMRIRHAQELLLKTELPQEAVASYCGFADIHHFSKTFRKHTGLTPGYWRNRRIVTNKMSDTANSISKGRPRSRR